MKIFHDRKSAEGVLGVEAIWDVPQLTIGVLREQGEGLSVGVVHDGDGLWEIVVLGNVKRDQVGDGVEGDRLIEVGAMFADMKSCCSLP